MFFSQSAQHIFTQQQVSLSVPFPLSTRSRYFRLCSHQVRMRNEPVKRLYQNVYLVAYPVGIQHCEIKLSNAIYYETRQMIRRQTIAQAHRQIKHLVIIYVFEGSTHTQKYIMTEVSNPLSSHTRTPVTCRPCLGALQLGMNSCIFEGEEACNFQSFKES